MRIICLIALIIIALAALGNYDFVTGAGKAQYSQSILPQFYAVSGSACLAFGVFQLFRDSKIIGSVITILSAILLFDFFKISSIIVKAASVTAGQEPNTATLIPLIFIAMLIFLLIFLRVFRMWRPTSKQSQTS